MAAGLNDGIVRDSPPTLVVHLLFREIRRIVVVPSYEDNPVVGFPEPSDNLVIDSLVVPRLFEAEAAIAGDNEQSVCEAVLNAQLENEALEVPVDVS